MTCRRVPALLLTVLTCQAYAWVWTEPANVSQNTAYNRWGCVFGAADGWHYSYMQGDIDHSDGWRIYYRHQAGNGSWSTPVRIGTIPRCEESRLGAYADGTRFIVFQGRAANGTEWFYSEQGAGGWSAPVPFTADDGLPDLCTNANRILDVGTDDTIHLLSQHSDGTQYNMRYYTRTRAGSVTDHGDVYDTGHYQLNGAVRVTGAGASQRVHFLVAGSGATTGDWRCHYRRWNNPGWGPLVNLSALVAADPDGAHAGNLVQLPSGRLIACLANQDASAAGDWEIWLLSSDNNGDNWHTPVNVSQTSGLSRSPNCAVDSAGEVVVAWEDSTNGPMQIMARRYDPAGNTLGERHTFGFGRGFDVDVASHGNEPRLTWHADGTGDWEIVTAINLDAEPTVTPTPTITPTPSITPTPTWSNTPRPRTASPTPTMGQAAGGLLLW